MKKHNLILSAVYYSEKELEDNSNLFDDIDWGWISIKQELSEKFIIKYKDKLVWPSISLFQRLSDSFINENIQDLNVSCLMLNKYISKSIKQEISLLKEII